MSDKPKKKKKREMTEEEREAWEKKNYADAAFRKRVTIIFSCILLAFIIGLCVVIGSAWSKTNKHNKEFEEQEARFAAEVAEIKSKIAETPEDKRSDIVIEITDDNFYDWIGLLDSTYNTTDRESENYARFKGCTVHIQGMIETKKYSSATQYWLYRLHDHEGHEHEHENEVGDGEEIPIEIIFDKEVKIPADGTWVDVTGTVGASSLGGSLSAIRHCTMTVMEEEGNAYIE